MVTLSVGGCVTLQQQSGNVQVTVFGGQMQWRESFFSGGSEIGPVVQQYGRNLTTSVW